MKVDFTKDEARSFLSVMQDDNDIVRLVDPVNRQVLDDNGLAITHQICHAVWGRCDRCENCTSLRAIQNQNTAYKLETMNSHTYWVCSRFLRIGGAPTIVELIRDVTDQLIMDTDQRDQLGTIIRGYNDLLITDPLTGIYNRRFLDEYFLPSLKCCHDEGITVNLAFIDMDNFKIINDKFGHKAGDQLLKDVAGFWKLHFNSRERGKERLVVRFGGDEILVIACGVSKSTFEYELQRFYKEMRKICYFSEQLQFEFDFTFGIASTENFDADWTWDALSEFADHAMYCNKRNKQNGISL